MQTASTFIIRSLVTLGEPIGRKTSNTLSVRPVRSGYYDRPCESFSPRFGPFFFDLEYSPGVSRESSEWVAHSLEAWFPISSEKMSNSSPFLLCQKHS